MQIFIARTLNKLLLLFMAVIVILFGGIFAASRFYPDYARWQILVFIVVSVTLALLYRWLEENWDKRIILKMVRSGKAALFNIKSGKRLMPLRDSSFRTCWIYELEGDLYNAAHEKLEKKIQEKMNKEMAEIPQGSVYVTYDETKPAQIFIIPNAMISSLPDLMPMVKGYEKDTTIPVRYLDVYYNKGMVLKTFRETLDDYKKKKTETETDTEKTK
ncbi:hypothetical protein AGMMS50230_06810 [Spirochaetia bacterium]|nr:hypothetical protein AGMMS50230_06810 [Spirochaetia bacterium]